MVGGFHVAGALVGERVPGLVERAARRRHRRARRRHRLAGQIFNLDEHWPSGILLWAVGAGAGVAGAAAAPQVALLAILVPGLAVSASGASPSGIASTG